MKKIAVLFVCLNPHYWPYLGQVIQDARERLLKGHQVDFLIWTDANDETIEKIIEERLSPFDSFYASDKDIKEILPKVLEHFVNVLTELAHYNRAVEQEGLLHLKFKYNASILPQGNGQYAVTLPEDVTKEFIIGCKEVVQKLVNVTFGSLLNLDKSCTVFPTEPVPWPYPTLMRYNLFLGQEEKLREYDYLFYLDADMRIVDTVGDEIIGEGLTMAEHPMYSLRREYIPPYEPNKDSSAFIPRLGAVVEEGGKPWFKPLYAAGGFQGGKTADFIEAMQVMRKNIDVDLDKNYIAIWNDESHWNRYLFGYKGHVTVLSPSYVYPDSLIEEYYVKIWGKKYEPKIITLTKGFTTSKEGGQALREKLQNM